MNREQEPVFVEGNPEWPRRIVLSVGRIYKIRAEYRVQPEDFFTAPIHVVHTTQTPALVPTHSCMQQGNNVRLETPLGTRLTAHVQRCLVIPAETEELCLYNLLWLSELPCLYSLAHMSRLLLVGLPLKTLPSLAPLSNLLHLVLEDLLEMTELSVGIGHAPKLHTLVIVTCPFVDEFPLELIEQLTMETQAGVDPHRIKRMHITRCGFNVPHDINRLVGMEELCLDSMVTGHQYGNKVGQKLEFPRIGQSFTALHSLTVKNHFEFETGLPLDMSGLTSLTLLKLEHMPIYTMPSNIRQLTALQKLVLKHTKLFSLPSELSELKNLKTLKLCDCNVLCSFAESIFAGCHNIQYLKFSYTPTLPRRKHNIGQRHDTRAYWNIALSARYMNNMKRIDIRGTCEFEADILRHAFMTWPPRDLQTLTIQESTHPKHKRELSDEQKKIEETPFYWNQALICFTAFASAHHTRLGANSKVSVLVIDMMRMIRDEYFQILETEFMVRWGPVIDKIAY